MLYEFIIKGMTCHACESLITMDLEEKKFMPKKIDHTTGSMIINIAEEKMNEVKNIIANTKKYSVEKINKIYDAC